MSRTLSVLTLDSYPVVLELHERDGRSLFELSIDHISLFFDTAEKAERAFYAIRFLKDVIYCKAEEEWLTCT